MLMKKFLFIWLINLLTLPLVCSQQISVELFAQDSRVGMQRGYGVYYANYRGWGAGLVFQSSDGKSAEITGSKYPFYGVELRIPVQQCGRLRSHFAPRIGIVNRNFLVIIPEFRQNI